MEAVLNAAPRHWETLARVAPPQRRPVSRIAITSGVSDSLLPVARQSREELAPMRMRRHPSERAHSALFDASVPAIGLPDREMIG